MYCGMRRPVSSHSYAGILRSQVHNCPYETLPGSSCGAAAADADVLPESAKSLKKFEASSSANHIVASRRPFESGVAAVRVSRETPRRAVRSSWGFGPPIRRDGGTLSTRAFDRPMRTTFVTDTSGVRTRAWLGVPLRVLCARSRASGFHSSD
jgi:hypothetical protein